MTRRRRSVRYSELTSLVDVMFIILFAALIQASAAGQASSGAAGAAAPASALDAGTDAEPPDAGRPSDAGARDAGSALPDSGSLAPAASSARPAHSADYQADRARAVAELTRTLGSRPAIVARVSAAGELVALERAADGGTARLALSVPLLAHVPDPDVVLAYLGDRAPEMRICTLARVNFGGAKLGDEIVVIVPEVSRAELSVALVQGLERDADRCYADEHAIGVLVEPAGASPDEPGAGGHGP